MRTNKLKREKAKMYAKAMYAQRDLYNIENQLDSIIEFFGIEKTGHEKLNALKVRISSWEEEMSNNGWSQFRIKNQIESIRTFFGIDKIYRDITVDVVGLSPAMYVSGKTMNCGCNEVPQYDKIILSERERDKRFLKLREEQRKQILDKFDISPSDIKPIPWPHTELTQELKDDCAVGTELLDCELMPRERAEQFMRDWKNRHLMGRKKRKKNRG